jgi:uncharacterized protein (UPF0332 family)
MTESATQSQTWGLALDFLREAEAVGAAHRPRTAMHGAYYAMFHGARAVLIGLDQARAPSGHSAVVGRFGFHARTANDTRLMSVGHLLNEVQDLRVQWDYRPTASPDPARAILAVTQARVFLEACSSAYSLPAPPPPLAPPS